MIAVSNITFGNQRVMCRVDCTEYPRHTIRITIRGDGTGTRITYAEMLGYPFFKEQVLARYWGGL